MRPFTVAEPPGGQSPTYWATCASCREFSTCSCCEALPTLRKTFWGCRASSSPTLPGEKATQYIHWFPKLNPGEMVTLIYHWETKEILVYTFPENVSPQSFWASLEHLLGTSTILCSKRFGYELKGSIYPSTWEIPSIPKWQKYHVLSNFSRIGLSFTITLQWCISELSLHCTGENIHWRHLSLGTSPLIKFIINT